MKVINVGACPGGEAFLIINGNNAALVDSGFSFCAEAMIENIKRELAGAPLDYCLLTHSHYDHASGSAYLKDHFPDVRIVASEYAAKIFAKPSAISVMRDLNNSAASQLGHIEDIAPDTASDKLDHIRPDITVREGDVLSFGELNLQVLDAPGHTRCSIAFFIPEENMLITCETMGVYGGEDIVIPGFLVGYEMSMNFIRRVREINPVKILVSHSGFFENEECKRFIDNSQRWNEHLKDLIVSEHAKGHGYEEILAAFKNAFQTDGLRRIQPTKAFDLNASYLIPMIIKEFTH